MRTGIKYEDLSGNFLRSIYENIANRAAGAQGTKSYIDFYTHENSEGVNAVDKLGERLFNGNTGRGMAALQQTLDLIQSASYLDKSDFGKFVLNINEPKRIKEQYATTKHNLFNTKNGAENVIMLDESQATDMLGKGAWRNNQNISNAVRIVSLDGYDENNEEHVKTLRDLMTNGKTFDGVKMIAQSLHGTGAKTVVRMVSEQLYNEVRDEWSAWGKEHGFKGDIWKLFENEQMQQLASAQKLSLKDLGKFYDAQNKLWTDSYDTGADFRGLKVGIVDWSDGGDNKYADGTSWATRKVLNNRSIQARGGLAFKGTTYSIDKANFGEYARDAGLLDDQGRYMVKGLNGEFDASDYDMLVDKSMIKNLFAYMGEDGKTVSSEDANKMLTALFQKVGLRAVSDFGHEGTNQSLLGHSAMAYIMTNPEMWMKQAQNAISRMNAVATLPGALQYIFTDPEGDLMSRNLRGPEAEEYWLSEDVQNRVRMYQDRIMKNMLEGAYDTFEAGDIPYLPLATTPWMAEMKANGGFKPGTIQKAKEAMEKTYERKFTDEEIMDFLTVKDDEVIDFDNDDLEFMSYLRDPVAYKNFASHLRNKAYEGKDHYSIKPIYEAFGLTQKGIVLSPAMLEVLGGADLDSDRVHAIRDQLLADRIEYSRQNMPDAPSDSSPTKAILTNVSVADTPGTMAQFAGVNVATVPAIGSAYQQGQRGMQAIDMLRPGNSLYLTAVGRSSGNYNKATTGQKDATTPDISDDSAALAALGLGKTFSDYASNISDIFTLDQDQLDALTAMHQDQGDAETGPIEPVRIEDIEKANDIFRASNGLRVNLRKLRELDIDRINMPSAYQASVLGPALAMHELWKAGKVTGNEWDAIIEATESNSGLGYGDFTPDTASYQL